MSTSINLDSLQPGQTATIAAVHTGDRTLFYRLSALGFRVGKHIQVIRHGWFAGPLHIRIGTTDVMMRRREAQQIEVQLAS